MIAGFIVIPSTVFVGAVFGSAAANSNPETVVSTAPFPSPSVREVAKPVTPESCKTFVEDSDRLLGLSSLALTYASDSFTAISEYDLEELENIREKIDKLKPQVEAARTQYDESKRLCESY